jgi:hypothetical protein
VVVFAATADWPMRHVVRIPLHFKSSTPNSPTLFPLLHSFLQIRSRFVIVWPQMHTLPHPNMSLDHSMHDTPEPEYTMQPASGARDPYATLEVQSFDENTQRPDLDVTVKPHKRKKKTKERRAVPWPPSKSPFTCPHRASIEHRQSLSPKPIPTPRLCRWVYPRPSMPSMTWLAHQVNTIRTLGS